jgi:DNA topoisomerase-1
MARDTPDDHIEGLVYLDDRESGIQRRKSGGGFTYLDPSGKRLTDPATLDRIASLVIPPAWTKVWISPHPRGHIQAVGRDARRRKQYRYHPLWRAHRDEAKYGRLHAFGRALPRLRARVEADLKRHGLPREKGLAAVVELLELTLIRVGNDEYARANKSFGLTTLRKRHAALSSAGAAFEFKGKSGVVHRTAFHDRRLARVLRDCQALPGQRLFQYVGEAGERRAVESHDVNDYLRAAMGDGFSAKDMRTWAGALLAARALAVEPAPESEAAAKRAVAACVKAVAADLGNTAAVCRACYIHPVVIEAFEQGALTPDLADAGRAGELALIRLLEKS